MKEVIFIRSIEANKKQEAITLKNNNNKKKKNKKPPTFLRNKKKNRDYLDIIWKLFFSWFWRFLKNVLGLQSLV